MVGVGLGRLQTNQRNLGNYDPVSRVISGITTPGSQILNSACQSVHDFNYGLFRARSLTLENERLKDQLRSYSHYTDTVMRFQKEVDELRKAQGFPVLPGRTRLPASITKMFYNERRLAINVGSKDGVKTGMPVVAPGGLFGRIQSVKADESIVVMLSSADPTNRFGAMVIRPLPNDPSPGLIRSEGINRLILEFSDPLAQVDQNDLVVTSGFSELIPRGIPIGRVFQVIDDKQFGKRQAVVIPIVSLGTVREVWVLK